jgi:hypothetical protein
MAAIDGGTAPPASLAREWVASPGRLSFLSDRKGVQMRLSSKAAGDMYANSVLSSSPMVGFRNLVQAGNVDVSKELGEREKLSDASAAFMPYSAPAAALKSQMWRQFSSHAENSSARANTGAAVMSHLSPEALTRGNLESAAPGHRLSRSLSTSSGVGRESYLHAHAPTVIGKSGVSHGMNHQLSRSLSPSSMGHAAQHQSTGPKEDTQGAVLILISCRV